MEMKKNCWQYTNCGREPGGAKAETEGVCPAAEAAWADGKHGGQMAGRYCWRVAGTYCGGKTQGTFASKMTNCATCPFYKVVREEEGEGFEKAPAGDAETVKENVGLSDFLQGLRRVREGDLGHRLPISKLHVDLASLAREINGFLIHNEETHGVSMALAEAVAEMGDVLTKVRGGELEQRLSPQLEDAGDQVVSSLAKSVNQLLAEFQTVIERQRYAIRELSTPVLEVAEKVLALPIIGVVDSLRSIDIMERLLAAIVERRAQAVIIDITGVAVVDTKTADQFVKIFRAASLLGAECILTGTQPSVAQTLVDLGVDLTGIKTKSTLQAGIEEIVERNLAKQNRKEH